MERPIGGADNLFFTQRALRAPQVGCIHLLRWPPRGRNHKDCLVEERIARLSSFLHLFYRAREGLKFFFGPPRLMNHGGDPPAPCTEVGKQADHQGTAAKREPLDQRTFPLF